MEQPSLEVPVEVAPKAPTANRKQRCGECAGCTALDCGGCRYCLNMRKYGGPGTLKQPCLARRCAGEILVPIDGPPAKKAKSGGGPRSFPVSQRAPAHKDAESQEDGGWGNLCIAALYSEGYEPFDPDVSAAVLDRYTQKLNGYDARATHFYCALDGGVAMSRCESMERFPDAEVLTKARPLHTEHASGRELLLASVALEPGICAMNMMPLPTWIEGEGEVGGYSRPLLASYESYFQAQNALRRGQELAYGEHFKAPQPFRNAKGDLIAVVHRSRMTSLRLSSAALSEVPEDGSGEACSGCKAEAHGSDNSDAESALKRLRLAARMKGPELAPTEDVYSFPKASGE